MAETRAVNRALRKAYGVALCSVEELPPWALSPQQIPQLRRTLRSPSLFQKGAHHAPPKSKASVRQRIETRWSKVCTAPAVVHFGPAGHAPNPCLAATFFILDPAPFAGRYVRTPPLLPRSSALEAPLVSA